MKLQPLLEWNRREALAIQQALIDHPDIEDAKLVRLDDDEVEFRVERPRRGYGWKVVIWDFLDGKKCGIKVIGANGIEQRGDSVVIPLHIASNVVGLIRRNPDKIFSET